LMALLGLDAALRERYRQQLSGGHDQRVGVGRGVAPNPQVLVKDYPIAALDPLTPGAHKADIISIPLTYKQNPANHT
ncbi:hypothetical protein ACVGX7_26015, partial [Enterobacter hormaechei]